MPTLLIQHFVRGDTRTSVHVHVRTLSYDDHAARCEMTITGLFSAVSEGLAGESQGLGGFRKCDPIGRDVVKVLEMFHSPPTRQPEVGHTSCI